MELKVKSQVGRFPIPQAWGADGNDAAQKNANKNSVVGKKKNKQQRQDKPDSDLKII